MDRDYDDHRGIAPPKNTFFTDTHDTDTLLLSIRLETVIGELGDLQRLQDFTDRAAASVSEAVIQRSEVFSKLRFLNDVYPAGFNIRMESYSPWKYIDVAEWSVNQETLHHDFANACKIGYAELIHLLSGVPPLKTWRDVKGHDCLKVLSIGLRQVLGSGKQVAETQLLSLLRLAFSEEDFRRTRLYADLEVWEQSVGLQVLLR